MSEDLKRYLELRDIMAGLLAAHTISALGLLEYQAAWRELETIKNKHGGMPPTE